MAINWYRTGTVSVTNGSATVTGNGTLWNTQAQPGDIFTIDGSTLYEIASVDSNTQLTLQTAYGGTTQSGVNYAIIRLYANSTNADLASRISNLIQQFQDTQDEVQAWLSGTYNGGPHNDGTYPITDLTGNVNYVPCPDKYDHDIAAVDLRSRTYYVDAVNGNDSNSGTSMANAFATIKKAIDIAPEGSIVNIIIKSGQVHQVTADIPISNKIVSIDTDVVPNPETQPNATIAFAATSSAADNSIYGFRLYYRSHLEITRCTLDVPARPDPALPWREQRRAAINCGNDPGSSVASALLNRCSATVRDDAYMAGTQDAMFLGLSLIHFSLTSADGTGGCLLLSVGGTAALSVAGNISRGGGAVWVSQLNTNPDGVHSLITNLNDTLTV